MVWPRSFAISQVNKRKNLKISAHQALIDTIWLFNNDKWVVLRVYLNWRLLYIVNKTVSSSLCYMLWVQLYSLNMTTADRVHQVQTWRYLNLTVNVFSNDLSIKGGMQRHRSHTLDRLGFASPPPHGPYGRYELILLISIIRFYSINMFYFICGKLVKICITYQFLPQRF